jgi:Spy/CpxP family protein refolding chaperone
MKRVSTFACLLAVASFLSLGCKPATNTAQAPAKAQADDHGHDHGDQGHPETLADGFKQLSEAYATIKTAFEADKLDDAHGPLHDVAHLLEDMKGMVEKSEMDADAKTKVAAGVETLFDAFGKIDGFFHGGPKVDFPELDKTIAPAMEELKGLIK